MNDSVIKFPKLFVYSMVYVQFEYLYKKRNIVIKGQVQEKTLHHVTLLQKANQRYYLDGLVDFFTQLFNYENQELGSVLVVLLSILTTEILAHLMFNTEQQGGYGHLGLMGLVLYTFLVQVLVNKQYKLCLLVALEVILSIGTAVVIRYQINDYQITGKFLTLNTACLLIGIVKKKMEENLNNMISTMFQFESNLLIAIYFIQKFLHLYLPYLKDQPLNSHNLIPVIACMALINFVKIWTLFEFNPTHLIAFLISVQKQQTKENEKLSLFDQIFLIGQKLHLKATKNLPQKNPFDQQNDEKTHEKPHEIPSQFEKLSRETFLPQNVLVDNDSIQESMDETISSQSTQKNNVQQISSPYTNFILIAFALNLIMAIGLISLILLKKYKDSELYLMSLGMFKLSLIMLYCEVQSVIMAEKQRHGWYYLLYGLSDIWIVTHFCLFYWLYDYFPYLNQYCSFSLAIHAILPFLTCIIYRALSQEAIQRQCNRSMVHFFVCWIFLVSVRQSVVVMAISEWNSGFVYIILDSFLLIYFTVMYLTTGKSQFYDWMFGEWQRMRKMRKYKLYVMESLRSWRYDITELGQGFFVINSIMLFLGYNQFRKDELKDSCASQTEYFIVCGWAFVAQLLQSYNNYYTQVELEQIRKPKYSPYINYVILMVGSGIYTAVSFLVNFQDDRHFLAHQRYSLLTLGLCIFLAFTNFFTHYSYETLQQFRHTSKPVNLLISYFIFYYPFITLFTIYFFNHNLQTQYIFSFAIAGFIYLTIASVIMGILVHAILNLTEKSKRTLFLVKAITETFKTINMKEDPEFIYMLENLYDLMDGDSDKLLSQLKDQKFSKILFHDDIYVEHDYSITQPDKKQNDFGKVFSQIMKKNSQKISHSKRLTLHTSTNIEEKKLKTKKLFLLNKSQEQTPKNKFVPLNLQKPKLQNKNHTQIKRLIDILNKMGPQSETKTKKTVQNSQSFKDILKNKEKLTENMHRFFHFLSDPEDSFNFETFSLINSLLKNKNGEDLKYEFNRFSFDGESINQEGFRDFIVNLMKSEIVNPLETDSSQKLWSLFMERYLFIFITKGDDIFKYYMGRKNVEISQRIKDLWDSLDNMEKAREMGDFRLKYNMRKNKALEKKNRSRVSNIEQQSGFFFGMLGKLSQNNSLQQGDKHEEGNETKNKEMIQQKKHIMFLTTDQIYTRLIQKLVSTLRQYEKTEHDNFKLEQIKLGLSNIISILTKLFDFSYLYMYGSVYAMYTYGKQNFYNSKYILSFVNYHIVFAVAIIGVFAYVGLIMFHKKQFSNGSLGVDENQRVISFTSLKFYTTFLLFLMGSSFANIFIMASLNSYICQQEQQTLWNFPENECYTDAHIMQMFGSLLILLTYYPLASLIFPFSSAIDRSLQIKYKAEYEIVYLQSKFLVNGINVIFNQMEFQTEELIKSATKTIVCIILAVLFYKLKPCSVEFINKIELKIYIVLAIINGAGVLCYFLDLQITLIIFFIVLLIFIVYLLCLSVKISNTEINGSTNEPNTLINQRFKKQQVFKIRLQQNNQNDPNLDSNLNLIKSKSQCLYEDISLNEKVEAQTSKFDYVQNRLKEQESPEGRPTKFKRKNRSNMLTIKVEEIANLNGGKMNMVQMKQNLVQMIPATKKKERGNKEHVNE